ncbi:GTP-binding protein [Arthrobacter crystallopoietes BAB-32]|uniref:GTP-binding protein n=1 Tax=Arthrobacter crystallopoietes BAB-32 TaxID=1246476 RepID=N1UX74_9MICC|nr:dynamin family protein [Arthrobacter crystallopoietes]EMY32432.1 GTP-binding protein [Arthrobacter crystallopoietes BAB-32]
MSAPAGTGQPHPAPISADVAALVRDAVVIYDGDTSATRLLTGYAQRLQEPLRVAIAGMVKAGKSTLLNAIIGEEIAPTDTGECTRIVTWYRHRDTPRITLHPADPAAGGPRALPVRRKDGRLEFELGGFHAEDVERLVVDWPAAGLRGLTLIDTPGIASLSTDVSARARSFLLPEDLPSEADAAVYLMRHLHASDLGFLEAFRDTAAGRSGTVNALAVLSRADEIGAGRIDSLLSAANIAERYRQDPALRSLALGVVPIAGLLAQSARTLRQREFAALRDIARLDRSNRERLLLSADRFVCDGGGTGSTGGERAALLERFGLFGIRLAAVLIRGGITDPTALAHELARRSGLDELLQLLAGQFKARAEHLKARTALIGVETLLREHPRPGTGQLEAALERIQANAHGFRELRLLAESRTAGLGLTPELAQEAERLVGGRGVGAAERLGLDRAASSGQLRDAALAALQRWRRVAANPLTGRAAAGSCQVVQRSCEAVLAELPQEPDSRAQPNRSSERPAAGRFVPGPEPTLGAGQQADQQPDGGETQLRQEQHAQG